MADAPLAAMIAAVRLEFESYEGSVRTSDDPHVAGLRAALRVLEALADRDAMSAIVAEVVCSDWDLNDPVDGGVRIVAALLARSAGG